MTLLSMRGVTRSWRRWGSPARPVLRGVDLDVEAGEVVGLVGASGSGKTTIARIAVGLVRPDAGLVRTVGVDPQLTRPDAQLLFQDAGAALNPGLTVRAILAESARAHGGHPDAVVERLGLAHRLDARPADLSGGEKRRVTLAMLTLANPRLVLADEPTAGLDAARQADVLDLLRAITGADRAMVLISHDLAVLRYVCTRLVVLHEGTIVEALPVDRLHEAKAPATLQLLHAWGKGPAA